MYLTTGAFPLGKCSALTSPLLVSRKSIFGHVVTDNCLAFLFAKSVRETKFHSTQTPLLYATVSCAIQFSLQCILCTSSFPCADSACFCSHPSTLQLPIFEYTCKSHTHLFTRDRSMSPGLLQRRSSTPIFAGAVTRVSCPGTGQPLLTLRAGLTLTLNMCL